MTDRHDQTAATNESSQSKQQQSRTIQVKLSGQAAKAMTPNQAAEYLKQIAAKQLGGPDAKLTLNPQIAKTANTPSSSVPSSSTTTNMTVADMARMTPQTSASIASSHTNSARTSLPLPSSSSSSSTKGLTIGGGNVGLGTGRKDGMPCSEKEMKALMSMFVEIMGLQMNTEILNNTKPSRKRAKKSKRSKQERLSTNSETQRDTATVDGSKTSSLFQFPDDLPPPPGGWPEDLMWPRTSGSSSGPLNKSMGTNEDEEDEEGDTSESDDESVDSLPELEEIDRTKGFLSQANDGLTTTPAESGFINPPVAQVDPEPVTGLEGIAAFEWEDLERAAIEEALEQEERARKVAKKQNTKAKAPRSIKSVSKSGFDMNDAEAQYEVAVRKQEKTCALWKNRVTQAVQANDTFRLDALLGKDSPITSDDLSSLFVDVLDSLAQLCPPKNRTSLEKGREARMKLTEYILSLRPASITQNHLRNGRTVFQTACFYADLDMMQLIAENHESKADLQVLCIDSGWAPLHYAAFSGSMHAVEFLLKSGCDTKQATNEASTWRKINGEGVCARELAECFVSGSEKEIESHGMALQEISKEFAGIDQQTYLALLSWIAKRLQIVEKDGYKARPVEEIQQEEENIRQNVVDKFQQGGESSKNSGKSKKKKKKGKGEEPTPDVQPDETETKTSVTKTESKSSGSSESSSRRENRVKTDDQSTGRSTETRDPVLNALLAMGFKQGQILMGIKACGGTERATVDDVVAWIIGQDGDNVESEAPRVSSSSARKAGAGGKFDQEKQSSGQGRRQEGRHQNKKPPFETKRDAAAQRAEEERLAAERQAKREEQRRRNREWNKRQEAQAKAAVHTVDVTAALQHSSHVPIGIPSVPPGKSFVQQVSPRGGPNASIDTRTRESFPRSIPENVVVHDAVTIASSIDITEYDDATVSTLGSIPARVATPVGMQTSTGSSNPQKMTQQIVTTGFSYSSSSPKQTFAQNVVDLRASSREFVPLHQMVPPPGIPETHPLTVDHVLPAPSNYANHGPGSGSELRLPMSQNTLHGPGEVGTTGLLGTHGLATTGLGNFSSGGHNIHGNRSVEPMNTPPPLSLHQPLYNTHELPVHTHSQVTSFTSVTQHAESQLGYPLHAQTPRPLDSSIIDSISTGNTGFIPGSSLWGNHETNAPKNGSSILANVIQTSQGDNERQSTSNTLFGRQNSDRESDLWGGGKHTQKSIW